MLKLTIEYDGSWRNSFLDGDNNSPLPKNGRGYIGSLKSLGDRNKDNFIKRSITHDTVMGVLMRLIGGQKKLYQYRASEDYPLADIDNESVVSFVDNIETLSEEIVFLRNFSNSTDQNSFSGMINSSHAAFTSDFSSDLWGVLFFDLEQLCDFILDNIAVSPIDCDPVLISDHYQSEISKIKNIKVENSKIDFLDKLLSAESFLSEKFEENYRNKDGSQIQVFSLYCSALYLQLDRLSENKDLTMMLSKQGNIPGFSKKGFTYKDFMKAFTTGNGKIVFGNPYFKERMVKGQGAFKEMLNKASGVLTISIDVNKERALEIKEFIKNAGVMSFPLGKKGLAYVHKIQVID